MIAFSTSDDWTAAQVTVTATGTDTYTFGAAEDDAVTAMDALVVWANGNGSFSGAVFGWSYDRHTAQSAMQLTLACDASMSLTFNAAAQSLLGFAASYSSTMTAAAPNAAAGTLYGAHVAERGHVTAAEREADATGHGATATTVSAWHPTRPRVAHLGDWSLPARARDVVAAAASPRRAKLHVGGSAWTEHAIGAVTRSRAGASLFRVELIALAEVA